MLPQFPAFKKLEYSDQADIERITQQYEPYSDFNFPCLWSWDVYGKVRVSELNGNLVVLSTEHFSDQPFYSFLGNNDTNKTLKQLFAFYDHMPNPQLRLIPEISLQNIDLNKYIIEIDFNNCDYVYDIMDLVIYPGNKFSTKRRMASNFLKVAVNPSVKTLDLSQPAHQREILNLTESWAANKVKQNGEVDTKKEFLALQRFLEAGFKDMLCVAVFVGDHLAGYSTFTFAPGKYAVGHFSKANTIHPGIYEYLMQESAKILLHRGYLYLNYMEDMGLAGLRFSKNSFNPTTFLRKYFIRES